MSVDIKIPVIGESVTEATVSSWLKPDGAYVQQGEPVCEIESDKATVEVPASTSGVLKRIAKEGDELPIGSKIGEIDAQGKAAVVEPATQQPKAVESATVQKLTDTLGGAFDKANQTNVAHPSPAAKKILEEKNISASSVSGTGKDGRITKEDAMNAQGKPSEAKASQEAAPSKAAVGERDVQREKMSRLRKTIAKRLVDAKNTTAMLTTFNEVDMYNVMELRKKYKDAFKEKHQIGLGFMSFFTKACTQALKAFPAVNGQIEGEDIILHNYADVGVAVSTPKGLVVPVVRNAEKMTLAEIEKEIVRLATRARDGKLSVDEMQGGTFTITNGGVFGSMLSTPLINIPQCAILGMHNIVDRPVAINGQVVIRPIMYVALSYDHRLVDGRESVGFLKTVKEYIEDPARLLLEV